MSQSIIDGSRVGGRGFAAPRRAFLFATGLAVACATSDRIEETVGQSTVPLTVTMRTLVLDSPHFSGMQATVTVAALSNTCRSDLGNQTNVVVWEKRNNPGSTSQPLGLRFANDCGRDPTPMVPLDLDTSVLGIPVGWPVAVPLTYYAEPHLIRLGTDNNFPNLVGLVSLVGPTSLGRPTNIAISIASTGGSTGLTWDSARTFLIADSSSGGVSTGTLEFSAASEMHAGTGQTPIDLHFVPSTGTRDLVVAWSYDHADGAGPLPYTRVVSYDGPSHVLKMDPVRAIPPKQIPPSTTLVVVGHSAILMGLADNITQNSQPYLWLSWPESSSLDQVNCDSGNTRASNVVNQAWHSLRTLAARALTWRRISANAAPTKGTTLELDRCRAARMGATARGRQTSDAILGTADTAQVRHCRNISAAVPLCIQPSAGLRSRRVVHHPLTLRRSSTTRVHRPAVRYLMTLGYANRD